MLLFDSIVKLEMEVFRLFRCFMHTNVHRCEHVLSTDAGFGGTGLITQPNTLEGWSHPWPSYCRICVEHKSPAGRLAEVCERECVCQSLQTCNYSAVPRKKRQMASSSERKDGGKKAEVDRERF